MLQCNGSMAEAMNILKKLARFFSSFVIFVCACDVHSVL
jgi:hypothetical protein